MITTLLSLLLAADADLEGLAMKPLDCEPAALCAGNLGSPGRRVESWLESAVLRQSRGKLKVVTPAKFVDLLKQSGYSDKQVREQCQNDECVAQLIGALSIEYLISAELVSLGDEGMELTLRLWGSEQSLATESAGAPTLAGLRKKLSPLVRLVLESVITPSGAPDLQPTATQAVASPVDQQTKKPKVDDSAGRGKHALVGLRWALPGLSLRYAYNFLNRIELAVGLAYHIDQRFVVEGKADVLLYGRLHDGFHAGLGAIVRSWQITPDESGGETGHDLVGGLLIGRRWNWSRGLFLKTSLTLGYSHVSGRTVTNRYGNTEDRDPLSGAGGESYVGVGFNF